MTMGMCLEHVALSVRDLPRSIAFYTTMLGFEYVDTVECPPERNLGQIVGLPGCSARIVHLKSGAMVLELFEYFDPRGRPIAPDRVQADLGLTHLGFACTDIHGDYQRLLQHGVRFYSPPIEYRPGVWNAYFYGPDGETCELRQVIQ
jgi:catechol 2,3-dioxygenase-like lactoylglutathione lyase family enzyme